MALNKANVEILKQTLLRTVTLDDYLKNHVLGKVPDKQISLHTIDPSSVQTAIVCPFHEDTKPSMTLFHQRQDWYCFGTCGTGGNIINLHMHSSQTLLGEQLTFIQAMQSLALLYKIEYPPLFTQDEILKPKPANQMRDEIFALFDRKPLKDKEITTVHYGVHLNEIETYLKLLKQHDKSKWTKEVVQLDYIMSLGLQEHELSSSLKLLRNSLKGIS